MIRCIKCHKIDFFYLCYNLLLYWKHPVVKTHHSPFLQDLDFQKTVLKQPNIFLGYTTTKDIIYTNII